MIMVIVVIGMSVKIGRMLNRRKTYVVGAPRSEETGQVFILEAAKTELVIRYKLTGEQIGSGFGYDVAIADINNDKYACFALTLVILTLVF